MASVRRATNLEVEWIGTGEPGFDRPGVGARRGRRLLVLAAGVLAAVVAVAIVTDRAESARGAQVESPAVVTTSAEFRAWRVLTPLDGSRRDGWPRPMVSVGDDICFGFENDAIGAPVRPSLARCVDRAELPPLGPSQVVSLVTVRSGRDVWHVLMTAEPVSSIEFRTSADGRVDDDRIHVDGRIVAARLATAEPIVELAWTIGRTETRCAPPGDVALDGRFCPLPAFNR